MAGRKSTQPQLKKIMKMLDLEQMAFALMEKYTWFSFPPINPDDGEAVRKKRERKTGVMMDYYPEQLHWDLTWACQPTNVQFHTLRREAWTKYLGEIYTEQPQVLDFMSVFTSRDPYERLQ